MSMLGQRVLTAVVLLALLVPALFAPQPWPFHVLTLLLIGAAGWEWGRLNQGGMGAVAGHGACCWRWPAWPRWRPAGRSSRRCWPGGWRRRCGWSVVPLALRSGPALWPQLPRLARLALGLAACGPPGWP